MVAISPKLVFKMESYTCHEPRQIPEMTLIRKEVLQLHRATAVRVLELVHFLI